MALRLNMVDIIRFTKRLMGQDPDIDTPFESEYIQDLLDITKAEFQWLLLDHDPDYLNYYARPLRFDTSVSDVSRRRRTADLTFNYYKRIGFIEDGYQLREGRDVAQTLHTPDSDNLVAATFTFTTGQDVGLYIFGDAYNPYRAAIDLMLSSTASNGLPVKQWRRGKASDTYGLNEKLGYYKSLAQILNRKFPSLMRA